MTLELTTLKHSDCLSTSLPLAQSRVHLSVSLSVCLSAGQPLSRLSASLILLATLQAIRDPYSQTACRWHSACLSPLSVRNMACAIDNVRATKLAALRATSPTGLSVCRSAGRPLCGTKTTEESQCTGSMCECMSE